MYLIRQIVFNKNVLQLFDPLTSSKKNDLQSHVVKFTVFFTRFYQN